MFVYKQYVLMYIGGCEEPSVGAGHLCQIHEQVDACKEECRLLILRLRLPVPEYRDIRVTWTGRPAGETVYCLSQIAKSTASQESVRKVLEYNGLTPVRVELVEPPVSDTHTTPVAPSVPQWQVTLPEPTTLREIKLTLENQVQIAYLIPSKNKTHLKLQQTLQTSSYAQALMRTRAPHGPNIDQIFPTHSVKKRKASEDMETAQPMESTL